MKKLLAHYYYLQQLVLPLPNGQLAKWRKLVYGRSSQSLQQRAAGKKYTGKHLHERGKP